MDGCNVITVTNQKGGVGKTTTTANLGIGLARQGKMEYYTMVGLVVGNVPLLYVLNKDWFHTLVFETPGKITLGICGAVIFVTYLFLMKFTKPVEYKG